MKGMILESTIDLHRESRSRNMGLSSSTVGAAPKRSFRKLLRGYTLIRNFWTNSKECIEVQILVYCLVNHEIAHLLHFIIYNSVDPYFEKSSDVDYGTEHQLFGGRTLVTVDLTKRGMELGSRRTQSISGKNISHPTVVGLTMES